MQNWEFITLNFFKSKNWFTSGKKRETNLKKQQKVLQLGPRDLDNRSARSYGCNAGFLKRIQRKTEQERVEERLCSKSPSKVASRVRAVFTV